VIRVRATRGLDPSAVWRREGAMSRWTSAHGPTTAANAPMLLLLVTLLVFANALPGGFV